MRRISSTTTWWYKRVFPIFLLGFTGLFAIAWTTGAALGRVPAITVPAPIVVGATAFLLYRVLVYPLVDEVWMDGDMVMVKNHGQVECFPVSNVLNVDAPVFANPERITLTLRSPCQFGREIVFMPPVRFLAARRHPIASELIEHIHGIDTSK